MPVQRFGEGLITVDARSLAIYTEKACLEVDGLMEQEQKVPRTAA